MKSFQLSTKGISLIEVIVVAAILLLFFGGLTSGFRYVFFIVTDTKIKQSALTLAEDRMEFIRSLSYDAVGTVGGIPSGALPQVSTSTLNNVDFTVRTLVEFVDDEADGLDSLDSNGITTDYKRAEVSVSWTYQGTEEVITLSTRVVPRSIETNTGGGTLRINVFDSAVAPLSGATVRVINTGVTPPIDTTRTTNASGVATFGGAPAAPGYEIIVTRAGFSTDATVAPTVAIPNPTSPPVTVVAGDITTTNFFIDRLSSIALKTRTERIESSLTYATTTLGDVATSNNIQAGSGGISLAVNSGPYFSNGSVRFTPRSPAPNLEWRGVMVDTAMPSGTEVRFRVYGDVAGVPTLIPDSDLPGNSSGFIDRFIDISSLSVATYGTLSIEATLTTVNTSITPAIRNISLLYTSTATPAPSSAIAIRGNKIIGLQSDSSPVYKFSDTRSTDSLGELLLSAVEADEYTFSISGQTITEICPRGPLVVAPNINMDASITFIPSPARSARVSVLDAATGRVLPGAAVVLSRTGYTTSGSTNSCGSYFVSTPPAGTDYTLTVSAPGYTPLVQSGIEINTNEVFVIQLSQ